MALYEKTASELSELLGKKEISAVELAKDVFARTKAVEDKVQGYVTVAEESALAQAEAVDKKRASGDTLRRAAVFDRGGINICQGARGHLRAPDAGGLQAAM